MEIVGGIKSSLKKSDDDYYCVIPKGSKILYTTNGYFVSDTLIVFSDEKEYDEYSKTHKIAEPLRIKRLDRTYIEL
jgi:hypothetical protein